MKKLYFILLLALCPLWLGAQVLPFEEAPIDMTATQNGCLLKGDLDGDGYTDYFQLGIHDPHVGQNYEYLAEIWMGSGSGSLTENTNHEISPLGFSGGVLFDADGDGDLDIFVGGMKENEQKIFELHLNNGNANFTKSQTIPSGLTSVRIAVGDLDNDGDLDVIATGKNSSNSVETKVFRNDNGTLNFVATSLPDVLGDVAIFQHNGSTHILCVGNGGGYLIAKLYRLTGAFQFDEITNHPFQPMGFNRIEIADLNNDGKLDVGLTGGIAASEQITLIYLSDGTGFGGPQELIGVIFGDLVFEDINADGYADAFVIGDTSNNGRVARLFLNDGTGYMDYNRAFGGALYYASAIIDDIDNDGDKDILYHGTTDFINPGDIKFWRNQTLGINDYDESSFVLYPNPTSGVVNLELPSGAGLASYHLGDITGKTLAKGSLSRGQERAQIDLSGLSNGVYLLTLRDDDGARITKRIIKQ